MNPRKRPRQSSRRGLGLLPVIAETAAMAELPQHAAKTMGLVRVVRVGQLLQQTIHLGAHRHLLSKQTSLQARKCYAKNFLLSAPGPAPMHGAGLGY